MQQKKIVTYPSSLEHKTKVWFLNISLKRVHIKIEAHAYTFLLYVVH